MMNAQIKPDIISAPFSLSTGAGFKKLLRYAKATPIPIKKLSNIGIGV